MSDLNYRPNGPIESLALNECEMRPTKGADGQRYWMLWFNVARQTDGVAEVFAVPVNVGGAFTEVGPGGMTWGLSAVSDGNWQVSPSINVLNTNDGNVLHTGPHPTLPSIWHQTPRIVGVPAGEPWEKAG